MSCIPNEADPDSDEFNVAYEWLMERQKETIDKIAIMLSVGEEGDYERDN